MPASTERFRSRRLTGILLYAGHLLLLPAVGGSNILLGFGVLSAPWTLAGPRDRPTDRWTRLLLLGVAIYAASLLLGVVASRDPHRSARELSEIFSLSTLVLGIFVFRSHQEIRRLIDCLVLLGIALSVMGLLQFSDGWGLDRRLTGPFSHYMTFSGVLLVIDVLLLADLAWRPGPKPLWKWIALAPIHLAIAGSLTRSAWIGLALAAGVILWLRMPRRAHILLPGLVLAVLLLSPAPVRERITSMVDPTDATTYDRLCMMNAGWLMFSEEPITGIGPGMVGILYPIYRHPASPQVQVPHLHNSFLDLAVERGALGLAAYLVLVGIVVLAVRAHLRDGKGEGTDLYLGALLALLAFNTAGLFEDNWADTEVQRLALFAMALPFAAASSEPDRAAPSEGGPPRP